MLLTGASSKGIRPLNRIGAQAGAVFILLSWVPDVGAQEASARASTRRSAAQHLHLAGALGFDHRSAVTNREGIGGSSELRARLHASIDQLAGFGLYLSGGVVTRFRGESLAEDPFADPYDELDTSRSLRINGAQVSYTLRNEDRVSRLAIRAGRIARLDDDAQLLIIDGLELEARPWRTVRLAVWGGRRALLDGNIWDNRDDALAQIAAGAKVSLDLSPVELEVAHRMEDVQRPSLGVSWAHKDILWLRLRGALLAAEDQDVAGTLRVEGDLRFDATAVLWDLSVQLGDDPRGFGRVGARPRPDEITAALGVPIPASTLDRIALGAAPPHVAGHVELEQWVHRLAVLHVGAYGRQPLSSDRTTGLRPAIGEVWGGAELVLPMFRLAAELRQSFEDPGEGASALSAAGDGVLRRTAVTAHGELNFAATDDVDIGLRPYFEVSVIDLEGPFVVATDQTGYAGAVTAFVKWGGGVSVLARYGFEQLPTLDAIMIDAVHRGEVALRGRY